MVAWLLLITLFAYASGADNDPFFCFHGESQNDKSSSSVSIKCPSKYCIRFSAVCNNYVAVTCYNESDPMSLLKTFTLAQKLYKNDPESALFEGCQYSKCNRFNLTDGNFVSTKAKPPLSFDKFLSTKVPTEKLYRELQNRMYYFYSRQENETFKATFDTVKTSKQAWISLDLKMKDNSTVRRKFIFDFVNGKVKLTKWIQQSNFTKPGEKLYFTVEYTTVGSKIFINNQFFQSLDNKVADILYLTYGGEILFNNATSMSFGTEYSLGTFSPEFHSNLIPAKKQLSTKIVNSPKVNVTSVNWEWDTSYILFPITPLKSFEKLNCEFRTDYKVNSDLVKVQVLAVPSNATSQILNYHVIMWSRADLNWVTYGKMIVKDCKKPNLFMTLGYISFYCDNSSKHSIAIYGEIKNAEFKNLYCNAKVQNFTCVK